MVYKLRKALYGLKQAPRTWFSRVESYFIKEGFKSSSSEQTLFIKRKGGQKIGKDENGAKVDVTLYKQIVGSLMYLTATRLDLMFVVSLISRFIARPAQQHFAAAKRILRYLKGTVDYGVFYRKGGVSDLNEFTNSDYTGDMEDNKSTSDYVFMMSGGAVAWSSRKQPIVTLSTIEAEFVAANACASQALWMRRILK